MADITNSPSDGEAMKTRLRGDLIAAMKQGDRATTSLIRQLIAALDDAEAVPVRQESASLVRHVFGEGTNEVARRRLSRDDVHALLRWELDARREAAAEFARLGVDARSATLAVEAEMIRRYLSE